MTVSRVSLAAAGLVVLQFLVRLALVPQSYWWQDDFLHLETARRLGFTTDLLVRDYNDHLELVPNAVYWLLTQVTTDSFAPAAVVLLVLQLVASVLMWLLLREIFGDKPALLVPFAAYLFTPILLVPLSWLAAGLEAWPLQIALLGTALGMVRLGSGGGRGWLWFATAAHVFGLVSWEKSLLVLPAVLGIQLLVVDMGRPWRLRLHHVAAHRAAWLWQLGIATVYLLLYASVVDGSEQAPTQAEYGRAVGDVVFRVLLPGLFGGPWRATGALNTIFPDPGQTLVVGFAVLAAGIVALTFRRNGIQALGPWVLVLLYVGADIALLLAGRTSFLLLVARDPRYVADAVPIVLIGATAAFLGASQIRRGQEAATPSPSLSSFAWPGVLAAALTVSGLLTTLLLFPTLTHDTTREYVSEVLARTDEEPAGSVVDTAVPTYVVAVADHRLVLSALGRSVGFDQPSTDMRIFDGRADLVPVRLVDPVLSVDGPGAACGWVVNDRDRVLAPIAVENNARLLQVGVLSGHEGVLTMTIGETVQSMPVTPGLSTASFVFPSARGDVEARFETEAGEPACISDLVYGMPWTTE